MATLPDSPVSTANQGRALYSFSTSTLASFEESQWDDGITARGFGDNTAQVPALKGTEQLKRTFGVSCVWHSAGTQGREGRFGSVRERTGVSLSPYHGAGVGQAGALHLQVREALQLVVRHGAGGLWRGGASREAGSASAFGRASVSASNTGDNRVGAAPLLLLFRGALLTRGG